MMTGAIAEAYFRAALIQQEQSSVPVSDADSESTTGDVSAFRVPLRHEAMAGVT